MNALLKILTIIIVLMASMNNVILDGLTIVTTFSNIADDVKLLVCSNDLVYSIVPAGVDPHEYQLTPKDLEVLSNADIIVSTAHTPFELKIGELIESGYLKATLLEIPKLAGLKLLKIPNTNMVNYHAVLYDPDNYLAFIRELINLTTSMRPECRDEYLTKLESITKAINEVKGNNLDRFKCNSVGSTPLVQYAVSWLGINVTAVLIKDLELPPTPADLINVEELIKSGSIDVVIVTEAGSTADKALTDIAGKYSVPVIRIPSYTAPGDTISKIKMTVSEVAGLHRASSAQYLISSNEILISVIMLVAVVVILAVIALIFSLPRKKRGFSGGPSVSRIYLGMSFTFGVVGGNQSSPRLGFPWNYLIDYSGMFPNQGIHYFITQHQNESGRVGHLPSR